MARFVLVDWEKFDPKINENEIVLAEGNENGILVYLKREKGRGDPEEVNLKVDRVFYTRVFFYFEGRISHFDSNSPDVFCAYWQRGANSLPSIEVRMSQTARRHLQLVRSRAF